MGCYVWPVEEIGDILAPLGIDAAEIVRASRLKGATFEQKYTGGLLRVA